MPEYTAIVEPGPDPDPAPETSYDPGVSMPEIFALRVRTPRGLGLVIRVRNDKKRPFLIHIDGAEKPYWALKDGIQPIGFSKATRLLAV